MLSYSPCSIVERSNQDYLITVGDGDIVNDGKNGGVALHANNSCSPNGQ